MSDIDESQTNVSEEQSTEVVEQDTSSEAEAQEQSENQESAEQQGEENTEQSESTDQNGEEEESDPIKAEEAEKERKRHNYEMAQRRIAAREQARKQVEQAIDQAYQPQQVDELTQKYLNEGYDEFQAQMLAREERRDQQAQINDVRTQVAELNMTLETESIQVLHDFPVFNPESPEYDKDFHQKAIALYRRTSGEIRDPRTNQVVHTNLTPYEFYKELAEAREAAIGQAKLQAQRAAERQMARVEPQTSGNYSARDTKFEDLPPAKQAEILRAKGHDF